MDLPRQFGRYTLHSLLGEGGMARVYEAEFRGPAGFRKRAAVKVIRLGALDRDEARTRALINEARVGGLLKHPNIVDTYDFGTVDGQPYVAMELVDGVDLARLLRSSGAPPVAVACSVAASICAGLHHAHELRDGGKLVDLVHRDLKPSNVLLGRSGEVKVMDFGLAKATSLSTGTTGTGVAKGTPPYMSPEQLQAIKLDRRSDLFALGALIYELFCGDRFFDQPTAPSIITAIVHVEERIAPPSKLDRLDERLLGLAAIARRCLRFDAADRYPDAATVRADLLRLSANVEPSGSIEDWLSGAVGELAPTSSWDRAARDPESGSSLELDMSARPSSDLPPTVVAPRSGGAAASSPPMDEVGPTRPAPARARRVRWRLPVFGLLLAVAIGLWLGPLSGPSTRSDPAPAVRTVLMTPTGFLEGQPALSPDGQRLLFVRDEPEVVSLWELDVPDDRRTRLLATPGTATRHPAWSPDGQRVALNRAGAGRGIYVADFAALRQDGEAALRQLTDFGVHPDWSPDGTRLAFSTATFDATSEVSYVVEPSQIWVVELASRSPVKIYDQHGNMPTWSPSGDRIAFFGIDEAGRRNVFTIPATGGDAIAVTTGDAIDWNPRWSSDGRHLFFVSDRSGAEAIWRIPVDPATGAPRGEPVQVTTGSAAAPGFLSVGGQGTRLAFHEVTRRWNVVTVPLDPATGKPTGEPTWLTRGDRRIRSAFPSPDGSQVVFTERRNQEDLFVADVATGQVRSITDDSAFDRGPTWSPDGERIAFFSNRGGAWGVWTIRPDGTDLVRAVAGAGWVPPRWAPDSRRLAVYDLESARLAVVTLGPDHVEVSRETVLLTTPPGTLPALYDWSPDGRSLLLGFEDVETWQGTCALYDTETGETIDIPYGEADDLRWFDEGRLLASASDGVGLVTWPEGEVTVTMELDEVLETWLVEVSDDGSLLLLVQGGETAGMRVIELGPER